VSHRILDPLERASEILFGLIMVLTFTGSISVAEGGHAEVRTTLIGAIGCNLAWGLVDATMYLMATFMARARNLATYRAVRQASGPESAHRLIRDALPDPVSAALSAPEVESLHQRLKRQPEPPARMSLTRTDLAGAVGVFLLVFLSTFPVVIPFVVMDEARAALRASNAIAIAMLFAVGWSLGRYSGGSGVKTGLVTVSVGIVLVTITMALGG
jgi:VIT1/CCC1 family predicted Fe2+/Mn2+ transporter